MLKHVWYTVAAIVACCVPIALYYAKRYVNRREARNRLYGEFSVFLRQCANVLFAVTRKAQHWTDDNTQKYLSIREAIYRAKENLSKLFDELKPCLSRGDEKIVDMALRNANSFLGMCEDAARKNEGLNEDIMKVYKELRIEVKKLKSR